MCLLGKAIRLLKQKLGEALAKGDGDHTRWQVSGIEANRDGTRDLGRNYNQEQEHEDNSYRYGPTYGVVQVDRVEHERAPPRRVSQNRGQDVGTREDGPPSYEAVVNGSA